MVCKSAALDVLNNQRPADSRSGKMAFHVSPASASPSPSACIKSPSDALKLRSAVHLKTNFSAQHFA
jgi:hypothetical protein